METYIAYFDESGDDGNESGSSDHFVLTSIYMPAKSWHSNYDKIKELRKSLKSDFGLHSTIEMHTKEFLTDKGIYRSFKWSREEKQAILVAFTKAIASLDVKIINVIIDKKRIRTAEYSVLENALKYNIQRIENDSNGNWNYLIISDRGRIGAMRKTARAIQAFNPIQSRYSYDYKNKPISYLLEDILEKDSKESYFIQLADFISFFVHLYFVIQYRNEGLPKRVYNVIDDNFVRSVMATLKVEPSVLNLKANERDPYGLVIYPR